MAVRSRGRPRTPAIPGRTYGLGITVAGDLKARLERAADMSGLTQSREAETRLEASFDRDRRVGGPRIQALLEALGAAALARYGPDWIDNPDAFRKVEQMWQDMLRTARPPVTGDRQLDELLGQIQAVAAQVANIAQLQPVLESLVRIFESVRAADDELAEPLSDDDAERTEEKA